MNFLHAVNFTQHFFDRTWLHSIHNMSLKSYAVLETTFHYSLESVVLHKYIEMLLFVKFVLPWSFVILKKYSIWTFSLHCIMKLWILAYNDEVHVLLTFMCLFLNKIILKNVIHGFCWYLILYEWSHICSMCK